MIYEEKHHIKKKNTHSNQPTKRKTQTPNNDKNTKEKLTNG